MTVIHAGRWGGRSAARAEAGELPMHLSVQRLVEDGGTVVVFEGQDDSGSAVFFAADHRPAQAIVSALEAGEEVEVEVESWQVLGSSHGVLL